MKKKITLIIPHKEKSSSGLEVLLKNIINWKMFPNEIIIINSSSVELNIKFFTNFCQKKKIYLLLENYLDLNPGTARNRGIVKSKNKILCFLDVKTIPSDNWFESGAKYISNSKLDGIFGQTFYKASSYKEKIIRASTYGCKNHITIPGSFFRKDIFYKTGLFIEKLRCGEDTDLIGRLNLHHLNIKNSRKNVIYTGLIGKNYFEILKKWKSNYSKVLEIPYFQAHKFIYCTFSLGLLFYIVFSWNWLFAQWNVNNILYIPNITKLFLVSLLVIYFLTRGLIIPIKKKVSIFFLLPFNFLLIFLLSSFLDVIKSYIFIKDFFYKILNYLHINK